MVGSIFSSWWPMPVKRAHAPSSSSDASKPKRGRDLRTSAPPRRGPADEEPLDRLVDRAPLVLVGLVAPKEVEAAPAAFDRVADAPGDEDDTGRELAGLRVDPGVVVVDGALVLEVDPGGDPAPVDREEREVDRPVGAGELEEAVQEAAARVAARGRREEAVGTPAALVEVDEGVEVGKRIVGPVEADLARAEAELGFPLPQSYRSFAKECGADAVKFQAVTADKITYLAISHSHWDHVGNANAYAGSTWLARKAEYDMMFGPGANAAASRNYAALAHSKIQYIDGDHDVFGDGSVVILSAPGHTPGHQVLLVNLARTGWLVLSGDLAHFKDNWDNDRVPTMNTSADQTRASRTRVQKVLDDRKAQLWINHDLPSFNSRKLSPQFYD